MTPQELRASILQQAIQGKLVEQRTEEGTGEELFQLIQAEKQALIKAGKIKKEKPVTEITEDEIPFDIPDGWKWVRVASITMLNPKNDLDDDVDAAFIPMPCVMDGFRNQHTFEVKKWGEIKKGFTHFADGDIGVAKITPCFQNRKSVIFRNLVNGYGAGTTELTIIRAIGETVLREYLLWFFKSDYFISNGVKSFTGTAGQQRIHKDYLATCLIPLPPLAEQKRIVAKLQGILPLWQPGRQTAGSHPGQFPDPVLPGGAGRRRLSGGKGLHRLRREKRNPSFSQGHRRGFLGILPGQRCQGRYHPGAVL